MQKRVTIKSIAQDLGISHMTVSRALSGHPNVQKETRDAIVSRARELGYVRNAAAKAMRGDGTGIVGLLLPNILNDFYARFANTMAQACEVRGRQLIIHLTNDEAEAEAKALERLCEVQAEAVVLVPVPDGNWPKGLLSSQPRVVHLIRQQAGDGPVPAVLVNDGPAIREGVRHLANQGHTKIGYIGADQKLSSGLLRLSAFREGLSQAGVSELPAAVRTGTPSFDLGHDSARELILSGDVSAIVCGGFEISNGALSALMATPGPASQEIAFIGYGDPSYYAWIQGGISTIRIPVDRMAHRAVELIVGPSKETPAEVESYDAELVLR